VVLRGSAPEARGGPKVRRVRHFSQNAERFHQAPNVLQEARGVRGELGGSVAQEAARVRQAGGRPKYNFGREQGFLKFGNPLASDRGELRKKDFGEEKGVATRRSEKKNVRKANAVFANERRQTPKTRAGAGVSEKFENYQNFEESGIKTRRRTKKGGRPHGLLIFYL